MNIAIVDDLEEDRIRLFDLLTEHMKRYDFEAQIQCFNSGEDFLATVKTDWADLCFMDIYMDGMSGVATAEQLHSIDPECVVIFLTSSPDHIDDAFRLRAWRYLQKPINLHKFEEALSKCMEHLRVSKRKLSVTIDRREIAIPFSSIYYVITADRSIEIHGENTAVTTGKQITFDTLTAPLLTDYRFIIASKGFILNMNYLKSVNKDCVLMKNGDSLPISRGKYTELSAALVRFRFGN